MKTFKAICASGILLLGSVSLTLNGQELDQVQISEFTSAAELSVPLLYAPGQGLYRNVQLGLDLNSGQFSILGGEQFMMHGRYYFLSPASEPSACLEAASEGGAAFADEEYGCQYSGQAWSIVEIDSLSDSEDDYFLLQSQFGAGNGWCLQDDTIDGTGNVANQPCDSASRLQYWKITPAVGNFYYLETKSRVGARECLDATSSPDSQIGVATCENKTSQLWYVRPIDDPDPLFNGYWNTECGSGCGPVILSQTGGEVTGTYADENGAGRITGSYDFSTRTLTGTWFRNGGSGPLVFSLDEDGQVFRGNWSGNAWCGWRENESQPEICSGP